MHKEAMEQVMGNVKKVGKWGGIGLLTAIIALNSYITVDSGESVRIQNNFTGNAEWHTTEGMKMKVPFFSKVHIYNSVTTVAVTDDEGIIESASVSRQPMPITFADNYGGRLEGSWRVKLPSSPDDLEYFHQDVKSQENFEGNTLLTFAKDMMNLTTDQFLAQDFMQGGKGAFKQRLEDQGANGMLVTKRQKVQVLGQVADGSKASGRDQAKTAKQFVYKVVIQTDRDGVALRRQHSLAKYNIEVFQTDLGEFTPSGDLVDYVSTIKSRERARAEVVANQSLERDKAVTEQLRGDRQVITVTNIALKAKAKAVINAEQQVELAELQATKETVERQKVADLAIIDKNRELQVAEANEGIQQANAVAAKHQASAIKLIGFADAAVDSAKLKAKQDNKTIYLAELNRDVAIQQAISMEKTTLDAPDTVIMGSMGGTTSDLLNVKLVQDVTSKR